MSFQRTAAGNILKLLLNGTAWANIADNAASSPITNIYISLHTADPGETGDQTTSEISYTGYARVAVVRTSSGWSINNDVASPVASIDFPASTGGAGGTVTHAGLGTSASGAGVLIASGAVTPTIAVANGVTPKLSTATTFTLS